MEKQKTQSIQEWLNLADIRGNILYGKDGMLFAFLSVQPISTALMTQNEKIQLTDLMTMELSPLRTPFKILFLSRPTDVRQIIHYYEQTKDNAIDTKRRDNLTHMIRYFSSMANSGGVLERKTYIMLWHSSGVHAEDELLTKAHEFVEALQNSGVKTELCTETEVIALMDLFYHPVRGGVSAFPTTPEILDWREMK